MTALVADAAQRAAAAPLSLQGLAETKGVIEHIAKLERRASAYGRSELQSGSGPATARRAAILADAGVQKAFGDAVLGVAHESASPAAVQAAAAHLLLPEEIAVATGASPYRVSIDAAMRQAEEEHQRRVPATDEAAASPRSRSTPSAGTVPGENDVRQAVAIFYETALRGTGMLDAGCSIATEPGCTVRTPGIAKTVYISTFELLGCDQDKGNKLVCEFTVAFHCGLTALSGSSSESLSNPIVRALYCADFGSGIPSNGQAYLVPTPNGWRILPERVPD